MKEFKSLTGLRGIAFINIFLLHMYTWRIKILPYSATWAVSFFIILSGFLYGYKNRSKEIIGDWKPDLKKTVSKIGSLYPLYFATLILLIPISGLFENFLLKDWDKFAYILFGHYLKDIFLLQSWIPVDYFCLNGASWYLSTLVFLLLLLNPILAFLKWGGVKLQRTIIVISPLFALLWSFVCMYNQLDLQFWAYVFPPFRVMEFMSGIALGLNYTNQLNDSKRSISEISSCGLIVFLILFMRLMHIEILNYSIVWIWPNLYLIKVFADEQGLISNFLQRKEIQFIGILSAECFIIHQALIRYLERFLADLSGRILVNACIMLITYAVTLLIAVVVKRLKDNMTLYRRR